MYRFLARSLTFLLFAATLAARHQQSSDVVNTHMRALSETIMRQRTARAIASMSRSRLAALNADVGNVAVIQDDGTLFTPINAFDLANKSLLFTRTSAGAYTAK